jgi:hypothetical protein
MRAKGFTLLELIAAFFILALFLTDVLLIRGGAEKLAADTIKDRKIRDLAQRKLFERMYFIEPENSGTFEIEGFKQTWNWEIDFPPEMVGQGTGDQFLLQYTIHVTSSESRGLDLGEVKQVFEMSAWTFPSQQWLDEYDAGYYDDYYGNGLYGSGAGFGSTSTGGSLGF